MPDLQTSIDLCTYCPRLCSHTCPVSLAEGRETVTPQAKMSFLGRLRAQPPHGADASPDASRPAAPTEAPLTAPLYACSGCGACTEACLHGVQPGHALLSGREVAESHGAGHPALIDIGRRQRERAIDAAEALRQTVPQDRRDPGAQAAYLPACLQGTSTGGGPAEEALRALRVYDRLAATRAEAAIAIAAPREACGGYPLYAAGHLQQFKIYAELFAREVAGHDTLVLGCPACTWLLRTQYPAHGVPLRPRVLHVSEHLQPLAANLAVRRRLPRAVYHDPCYLGRHLQIYDEPRELAARAVESLGDFAKKREQAACSGGGGLLPLTMPETALAIARERVSELHEDDRVVVTACPSCQRQLGRGGAGRVLGLLELLDEATAD